MDEQLNQQPIEQKKSKSWKWILGILVLIAIGVGIYFWLSGGDSSSILGSGNSIPQPPALPE